MMLDLTYKILFKLILLDYSSFSYHDWDVKSFKIFEISSGQLIKAGDTGRSLKSRISESWYSDEDGISSNSLETGGRTELGFPV